MSGSYRQLDGDAKFKFDVSCVLGRLYS